MKLYVYLLTKMVQNYTLLF